MAAGTSVAAPASVDPDAVATRQRLIFEAVSQVSSIMESIGVPFWLNGGTLLGAVRDGGIIPGDTDWDIDCLDESAEKIAAARDLFLQHGFRIEYPFSKPTLAIDSDETKTVDSRLIKVRGRFGVQGDIYLYTVFSDGILRRYDFENNALYNPKMSWPAWFIEEPNSIEMNGRSFPVPRDPEVILHKIYGPLWTTPMTRQDTPPGYNFGGAWLDADLEGVIRHSLSKGWNTSYDGRPAWPQPIRYTNSKAGKSWIKRHEVLASAFMDAQREGQERAAPLSPHAALMEYRILSAQLMRQVTTSQQAAKKLAKDFEKATRKLTAASEKHEALSQKSKAAKAQIAELKADLKLVKKRLAQAEKELAMGMVQRTFRRIKRGYTRHSRPSPQSAR